MKVMEVKSKQVQVGDVITSPLFTKGEFNYGAYSVGEGNRIRKIKETDCFVVEEAKMGGGGTGHGPQDVYPDAWQVTARRLYEPCGLQEFGTYDPRGLVIKFNQRTNCYHFTINEVTVLGKMKKVVNFVKER